MASNILKLASSDANYDKISSLLGEGADVESARSDGWTALCTASFHGQDKIVGLLITHGANIDASRTDNGWNALYAAASMGKESTVRVLVDRGGQGLVNRAVARPEGSTPLHAAASKGFLGTVAALIEAGADLDARQSDGNSALLLAAERGHAETLGRLLEAGASPEERNGKGETALICAACSGDTAVVRVLVRRGADLNARDADGRTALMWAAKLGREDVCAVLARLPRCDTSATDAQGNTATALATGYAGGALEHAMRMRAFMTTMMIRRRLEQGGRTSGGAGPSGDAGSLAVLNPDVLEVIADWCLMKH